jgi:hypothetical protein
LFRHLLLQIGGANIENPPTYFVVARTGSRAAVLWRSEPARFSSASDDKVAGFPGAIRSERQRAIKHRKNPPLSPPQPAARDI